MTFRPRIGGKSFDQAEIVYDLVLIAEVPDNLKSNDPHIVWVLAEDAAEARVLVEPFQVPLEEHLQPPVERGDIADGPGARSVTPSVAALPSCSSYALVRVCSLFSYI